jgi:hypothetical protein
MLIGLGQGLQNFSTILGKHNEMNRLEQQKQLDRERTQHLESLRQQHAMKLQESSQGFTADQNALNRAQQTEQFGITSSLQRDQLTMQEKQGDRSYEAQVKRWEKEDQQFFASEEDRKANRALQQEQFDFLVRKYEEEKTEDPAQIKTVLRVQELVKAGEITPEVGNALLGVKSTGQPTVEDRINAAKVLKDFPVVDETNIHTVNQLLEIVDPEAPPFEVGHKVADGLKGFFGGTDIAVIPGAPKSALKGLAEGTSGKEYAAKDIPVILERLNSMSPAEQEEAMAQLGPKTQAAVMELSTKQSTTTSAPPAATTPAAVGGTYAELQAHAGGYAATRESTKEKAIVERWNQENPNKKITEASELPIGLRNATWKAVQKKQ